MNKKQRTNSRRNIWLVLALCSLLIFSLLVYYLWKEKLIVPSAQISGPSFSLTRENSSQIETGSNFNVNIVLNTDGQSVSGVDIMYLNFNPSLLKVQDADAGNEGTQIQAGSLLPLTLDNGADNSSGKIKFLAGKNFNGTGAFSGSGVLATVTFQALMAGTANVNFDFSSGLTNDSNLWLDNADYVDILAAVENGTYTIGNPVTPTPTPTATSTSGTGNGKKTPTPSPTNISTAQTPTSEVGPSEEVSESPAETSVQEPTSVTSPPAAVVLASPSPARSSLFSPTPRRSFGPTASGTPTSGRLAGSNNWKVGLVFYLGLPTVATLIAYLVWREIKRRRGQLPPSNKT